MTREPQDVTEAELGLMQALWDRGRSSTRQITDLLYPNGGQTQYATVQKLLERLEGKGFITRDRSLFVHTFTAAVERDELIGRRIRGLADKLCGGSLVPILTHLARNPSLSEQERKALRELIDEPETPVQRQPKRGRGRKG
ncbi:MAG: mecI 4 [Phycisphaerales bacterium]|jgi:BlaI family transcriptional regulator, penicillinase repressor|nr:mecI 4 [Phycisphaerales bacterium]MDB5358003.1 mecI 4 [Phycisphaerales bacterium]